MARKWFTDNKREFVAAGSVLLASLILYLAVSQPKLRAAEENEARIRSLDAAIQESSLEVDQMSRLFSTASDVEDVSVQEDEKILPALLEAIASKGEDHGVEIVSMKPTAIDRVEIAGSELEGFRAESTRLVVTVTVEARYHALGKYLESLETIPVLVAVRKLNIERIDERSSLLRAAFEIETYSIRTHEKTE